MAVPVRGNRYIRNLGLFHLSRDGFLSRRLFRSLSSRYLPTRSYVAMNRGES